MNILDFVVKVRKAIVDAQKLGWCIDCGITVEDGSCCPIGALYVAYGDGIGPDECEDFDDFTTIAADFGLSAEDAQAFVDGFDGTNVPSGDTPMYPSDSPFLALGKKLRAELL